MTIKEYKETMELERRMYSLELRKSTRRWHMVWRWNGRRLDSNL